ncbi:anti-sigma factor family protein [Bacillus solimangrovi]|uniref:Anti-sigma-W factor RsiW n=1 Tax=Bacillus solimangrovi TaxID=1305675 RepID=A0A1E5LHE2_9BACI|nr:zf-HC2 domain-containing protein [Bacillus solimangrovi]OEH93499.1 hypothetical protein BFG57_00455 [Bacillus solimangrovi]
MKCLTDEQLQSYLDEELTVEGRDYVEQHIQTCKACKQQLEDLREINILFGQGFTETEHDLNNIEINTEQAWSAFENKVIEKDSKVEQLQMYVKKKGRWENMKKTTKSLIIGGAAAVMIGVFSIPQVQVAASNFLSVFRVNEAEFLKLTTQDINEVENWIVSNEAGEIDLKGLGKISIDEEVQERSYSFATKESMEEAGFKAPKDINNYTFTNSYVTTPISLTMELNVDKMNELLASMNIEEQFDEKMDQKPFSITVPQATHTSYESNEDNVKVQSFTHTVIGAPEYMIPEDVDLNELSQTILAMPFFPDNVKKQLSSIDDWTQTLPVPIMEMEGQTTKEIMLNGKEAIGVETEYSTYLMWQDNGEVHYLDAYTEENETSLLPELVEFAKQL